MTVTILENIIEFFKTLALVECIVLGATAVLFFLLVLLLIYAAWLRMAANLRERRTRLLRADWEIVVLDTLDDHRGETPPLPLSVLPQDLMAFGEFIDEYLWDLAGDDYDRIVQMLYRIGLPAMLTRLVATGTIWERAYCIYFFGMLRVQDAEPQLRKMVGSGQPVIALSAFEALHRMGSTTDLQQVVKEVLSAEEINHPKVADIITGYADAINPVLIRLLGDADLSVRAKRLVVDMISVRRVAASTAALITAAREHPDTEFIIGCIKALGALGDPAGAGFLRNKLNDTYWVVRSQSARSLGMVGDDSDIPRLFGLLEHDTSYWVKLHAAQALRDLGKKGGEILATLAENTANDEPATIARFVLTEVPR